MPTFSTITPENVMHGTEIQLQVQQSNGALITLGEVHTLTWDEDQDPQKLPVMGSRIVATRWGQFRVKGQIRGYFINGTVRALWQGQAAAISSAASAVYHHRTGFNRYQITLTTTNTGGAYGSGGFSNFILYGVVFEKDAVNWAADKFSDETVDFSAETVFAL